MTNTIDNYTPKSEFLKVMLERGFIHQCTNPEELDKRLQSSVVSAYIGFDCTASSLHVGSLVQIMMLRHLQKSGHRPIALMGGGTTKIGDPSGKDESRKILTYDKINQNMEGIKTSFTRYLNFGNGPSDAIMPNNADWLDSIMYIDLLRNVGPHFTINRMLTFESVKMRLDRENPLTFLEFNYMILQAYDFVELQRRAGCVMQMGGSDQWGNIINGVELNRRMDQKEVFGLTTPLITLASGAKMGKTASGAVWLNKNLCSSYDFWQFWRNTADEDVGRFLALFTELPMDEVRRLEALQGQEINEAKKVLANAVTRMLHGKEAANKAEETAKKAFEDHSLAANLPTIKVIKSDLEDGIPVSELYIKAALGNSKGEVRRLIKGGGAKINDQKITDGEMIVSLDHLNDQGNIKLSAGKKRHILIMLK
jgi:tyrosyl-tRNA synthetase|tara:strand:+ start:6624 stop:7895 length:1272 start_codon:yes stop_codon:yes gene_type:complete